MSNTPQVAFARLEVASQRLGMVVVRLDRDERAVVSEALDAVVNFSNVVAFDAWSNAIEAAGVSAEQQVEIAALVALEVAKSSALLAAT